MRVSEAMLLKDLELLRHGGAEAVSLFMEMAHRMQRAAGGALQDWVTVALPALPERERAQVVILLMEPRLPKRRRALH